MPNPADDDVVELRFMVPRWVAEVIDAHVAAKRADSRIHLAKKVFSEWARSEIHLATVVGRVTRGNGKAPPVDAHSDWGGLDDANQ